MPYLTDWEPLSPDNLAQLFAGSHPFRKWSLSSRQLHADGSYSVLRPRSWEDIAIDLEDLERDLKGQPHADWRRRAVGLLPAGVFVWLDELESEIGPSEIVYGKTRLPSGAWRLELNFQPLLSAAEAEIAYQGFTLGRSAPSRPATTDTPAAPVLALQVADDLPPAPDKPPKRKRRGWMEVAGPHIVERLRAGSFSTAVELNHALYADAGSAASPFDKGSGRHRGNLFVRETCKSLTLKTIQNNWRILNDKAEKA